MKNQDWLNVIQWNEQGLVPVITQDVSTNRVLMLAWINRTALEKTLQCGEAVYWSRSRNRLWHQGEESGHIQKIVDIQHLCRFPFVDFARIVFIIRLEGF